MPQSIRRVPHVSVLRAAVLTFRATRPFPLNHLPLGSLSTQEERLGKLAFTADFERTEILVPKTLRRLRLGFAPQF